MVSLIFVSTLLLGCTKAFKNLEPREATHALGVCSAYHMVVKKDLDTLSEKIRTLMSYSNVRGNLTDVGQDWIARYFMGDKEVLLQEATEGCRVSGLPT